MQGEGGEEAEAKEREEERVAREAALEENLANCVVRTQPMGFDRHFRRYWWFAGGPLCPWLCGVWRLGAVVTTGDMCVRACVRDTGITCPCRVQIGTERESLCVRTALSSLCPCAPCHSANNEKASHAKQKFPHSHLEDFSAVEHAPIRLSMGASMAKQAVLTATAHTPPSS